MIFKKSLSSWDGLQSTIFTEHPVLYIIGIVTTNTDLNNEKRIHIYPTKTDIL